jgi:hypothetical protein
MAYDSARDRIVLFGGAPGHSDTWEWDGTTWLQRTPPLSPPQRYGHAMAYDSARGWVVLFGGTGSGTLNDTWEWNGATWLQRTPANSPPGRYHHAMAYGGSGLSDTWEWDGTNWLQRATAVSPGPRRFHAMAWDSGRGRAVLFGGEPVAGHSPSDTWELSTPVDPAGPGQPGGGAIPLTVGGTPRIGASFCVGFSNPSPTPAGFNLLMLAPGLPARPPFTIQPPAVCSTALLHLIPLLVLSSLGNPASFCFAIPALPALAGASFTVQGASLEIGVCFRGTDALVITIQP